jgi:hypothetical protein
MFYHCIIQCNFLTKCFDLIWNISYSSIFFKETLAIGFLRTENVNHSDNHRFRCSLEFISDSNDNNRYAKLVVQYARKIGIAKRNLYYR